MHKVWYTIANSIWKLAKGFWQAVVVAILVGVAIALFSGSQGGLAKSVFIAVIDWFHILGTPQRLTIGLILILVFLSFASGIIVAIYRSYESLYTPPREVQAILDYFKKDMEVTQQREKVEQTRDKEAFTQYLRSLIETCKSVKTGELAQYSRALVFAEIPLLAIFVHLQVVLDEPVYDAPGEQQRQLEAIRQRTDLSIEERNAYLQRLRTIWQSQLRQAVIGEQAQQPLPLEEILSQLTTTNPAAILLGTPGSGKTIFLRWVTLHMAQASLSPDTYSLPNSFGRTQVPILIQTKEYAESLDKEYLTLKQFLILRWSKIHPNLPMKLLDELAQGRCLVLFDGLDQGATASVRRRVIEAIQEFIADYSVEEPNHYNRFIVTSRIADSEPGAFAKYPHYTLLDLNAQQLEQFLQKWCLALVGYRTMALKGMQPLTGQEEGEAQIVGDKQRKQLLHILKSNPDLMHLATSPLALTIMLLLQISGRNILQHRIQLYQMVTRTLLDSWNRESGHRMFSGEEVPLVEQLLSKLAYSLYESDTPLTAYDVVTTTRQTLAMFHQRQPDEIRESEVIQFIETLRRNSGLFVEGGEDLFYFANCTLQYYYVVLYLLHMPQEELKQIALLHQHSARWHEPLLLALKHKSRQLSATERTRQLSEPAPSRELPTQPLIQSNSEERTRNLQTLQGMQLLRKQQVEELLVACTDTRPLTVDIQQTLGVGTIQEMAQELLRQPFVLEYEAFNSVLKALDSSQAPICEGAAILLHYNKRLPQDIQQRAAQKIWQMFIDNDIHRRFSKLGYFELLRLYDTLFETLKVITDYS